MKNKAIKVLLVEPSQSMTKRIVLLLQSDQCLEFDVTSVQQISKADDAMLKTHVDIVLLDLSITKNNSADYVEHLLTHSPKIIIILLCRKMDTVIAQQAMAKGAHDCLDKSHIGLSCLRRVLEYNLKMVKSQHLLAVSEATLHATGQASPLGIMVSDLNGNITYTNAAFQHLTGLKAAQSLGQHWITPVYQQDRLRLEEEWRQALQVQQIFYSDVRLTSADLKPFRARMAGSFIKNNKALYGHVRVIQGITKQHHQSAVINLFLQNPRAGLPVNFPQLTLDAISDAVLTTDTEGKVLYMNQAAERMTGWKHYQATGQLVTDIFKINERHEKPSSVNLRNRSNQQSNPFFRDCTLVSRGGQEVIIEQSSAPINNQYGAFIGSVFVFRDVTQSRIFTQEMNHLAHHDSLTGLPNRTLLLERLNYSIKLAKRHKNQLAVLYIDVDFFKQINDRHGHAIGDKLLSLIAKCITRAIRDSDTVCRQGGDEFIVLLSEIHHSNDAAKLANKLLTSLASAHQIANKALSITISIGISIYPNDGNSSNTLMDSADMAMLDAKSNGRNRYEFSAHSMPASATGR